MTPHQEFLRRVELKLQEIRYHLDEGLVNIAKNRLMDLERLVADEAATTKRRR